MPPAVTIKTVAQAVGVSPSTVSNAYNKPGQLSAALRERILAVADDLGYAGPDATARALRSGRAGSIGVLFTDRLSYAFSDPFAVAFLAGVAAEAERTATSLLLMPVSNPDDEPAAIAVRQAAIDGAVVFCVEEGHPALGTLRARDIPISSTDRADDPDARWVAIDESAAAASVGAHLARLGHRDIAVLLDTNRPAAIAAFSDVLALGAIEAMRARGLTAGRDISVTGFDDVPAAEAAGLTTVRQPVAEKGRLAARQLLSPGDVDPQILLPTELIVRSSTGPAPRR